MPEAAEARLKELSSAGPAAPSGRRALFIMGSCRMKVAANDPQPDSLMEGLTSVATVAALSGWTAEILDCRRDTGYERALRAAAAADLVLFPVYLSQLGFFSGLCRALREAFPDKPLLAGGPLPTALPEETAAFLGLDGVVVGEGELTMLDLLAAFERGGRSALRGIPGLYLPGGGPLLPRAQIEDLCSLPFPDHSLWGGKIPVEPFAAGISSVRGCAGACSFCSKTVTGLRRKSLARFEAELLALKTRTGASAVMLNDPHLNRGPESAALCDVFGRAGVEYFCFLRVGDITPELASRLKATGCRGVYIGVESYNEDLLRGINKQNGSLEGMEAAVRAVSAAGLRCVCGLIFGLPGETRATLENTMAFIERNRFLPDVHYLTLDPGSRLFREARGSGMVKDPMAYLLALENDEGAHMEATAGLTGVPSGLVAEYLGRAWAIKEERLRRYAADLARP